MSGKNVYDGKLRSKIEVRLTGREKERLIKLCGVNGIELRRLHKEEDGKAYRFTMWADEFYDIRPYLRKTTCRARIVRREGTALYVKRNRKRLLFPVGVLLAFICVFGLMQFVWKIDIEGNTRYTDDIIYGFLEEQNISFGLPKAAIYTSQLEESLRDRFPEITWVSVQLNGTHMTVNVKEDDQLDAAIQLENGNILASQEGVITKLVVRSGVTGIKEGDTVIPGQVLIAGMVELKDDAGNPIGTKAVRADGEIYARVTYQYEDQFFLSHEIREYDEKTVKGFSLVIGKYRISFPVLGKLWDNFDTLTQRTQLYLGSNYYLPVYWEKTIYRNYVRKVEDYSREDANSVAGKRFEEYLKKRRQDGYEIISSQMEMQIKGGICRVTGTYEAESQIGVSEKMWLENK